MTNLEKLVDICKTDPIVLPCILARYVTCFKCPMYEIHPCNLNKDHKCVIAWKEWLESEATWKDWMDIRNIR